MAQEYTVEQLNHGRKVWDFMRWDYWAFGISGFLLILSIVIMGVKGFNWGLDFTGGTVIEISLEKPVDMDQMRESLQKAGFEEPLLQNFGSSRDIMVRMPPVHDANGSQELGSKVVSVINETTSQNAAVKRIEFVGPSVGADLAQTGAMALLVALISILVYVGFRFEWRLAAGVVIALAHDVVITMGILSLFHIEIDLTIVASLMSVIGYSLNDSIVVSDRIRENFRKIRRGTPYEIFNVSLTQIRYHPDGDPDAVPLRWSGTGRLLADHADRCHHRYGVVYLRRVRSGTETRHEARAPAPAESRERRGGSAVHSAVRRRLARIKIPGRLTGIFFICS